MSWTLAVTPPNRELALARALTDFEFPNHVFKVRTRRVHRGRLIDRIRPAFPRYLFLDPRNAWNIIRGRFASLDFVRDGNYIANVPEQAVTSLVKIADADGVLPTPEKISTKFHLGDRVRINGASLLAGYPAVYQHSVGNEQHMVLIDWMGRYVPVAVDERDLVIEIEIVKPITQSVRTRRRRRRHRQKARNRNQSQDCGAPR